MLASLKAFLTQHQKYLPVLFFVGGFIWDSLTLGRVDGWYSNTILFLYLGCLTTCLYIYNLKDDEHWQNTFLEPYQQYAPYAIQFFLGGLSSAYVIFFFQSVSLSKTIVFFLILVLLLFSNELLKHRISNKYLQFSAYFFVNFTFFIFFLPILSGVMSTFVFIIAGLLSMILTGYVIILIYRKSPSTQQEVHIGKLSAIIIGIYLTINVLYYFNLIPPVPLSLQNGMVAYQVEKQDDTFYVTFEQPGLFSFGKSYDQTFSYTEMDTVFVYTSIFAPTDLEKAVLHDWQWYEPGKDQWNSTDKISYEVTGGRRGGFRGYTYKENVWPGFWKVDVTTDEGLVLGVIKFEIVPDSGFAGSNLVRRQFN